MIRAGLIVTLVLATPAQAYLARNGMVVEATGPGSFEVPWSGQSGAPAFWCAAGDYVTRGLGLSGSTRIYRYDPPVRSRGAGIRFGLDPRGAQPTGLVGFFRDRGVLASHARRFCEGAARRGGRG